MSGGLCWLEIILEKAGDGMDELILDWGCIRLGHYLIKFPIYCLIRFSSLCRVFFC